MSAFDSNTEAATVASANASNIAGKVILSTGVSPSSLGSAFLNTIAIHKPSLLILASRNLSTLASTASSLKSAAPDVEIRLLELDLNSQKSVRKAAAEVNAYTEKIDVLVLNAGLMAIPYATTEEGIERTFGVNHVGHFLFTNLIVGKLLGGEEPRIVVVGSDGYRLSHIRFTDVNFSEGEAYDKWRGYGQSKTANLLFAKSLALKLGKKGLLAVAIHPGVIWGTNLGAHLADDPSFGGLFEFDKTNGTQSDAKTMETFRFKTLEEGVSTHVYASFDKGLTAQDNGAYLEDCGVMSAEKMWCWGRDPVDAEKLWKLSEELVGQKFEY